MKKILFICLFLFSNNLFAGSAMEFVLTNIDNKLRIYLLNSASEPIFINKRFAIGSSSGPNEVEIIFTKSNGKVFPFSAKIKLGSAEEKDFMALDPGMFIGREFDIKKLSNYYALDAGEYQIKAVYKNKHDAKAGIAFKGKLESNTVSIIVSLDD